MDLGDDQMVLGCYGRIVAKGLEVTHEVHHMSGYTHRVLERHAGVCIRGFDLLGF